MDGTLIILLMLLDKGPRTIQEILNSLREEFGEECSWGENDLGLDLHDLVNASDYVTLNGSGQYTITGSGINVLKTNKKLRYIFKTMNWLDQLRAAGRA